MSNKVHTVLGPKEAHKLGKTMIHEHFAFGYPGYQGDVTIGEVNWDKALEVGIRTAERLKAWGVQTVVDPTPNECGRNPELLRKISEATGLQIICATGYYYEGGGASSYFRARRAFGNAEAEIHEMFVREITEGIGRTGIKPGIIKLASSRGEITRYEQMFFRSGAKAQRETGVPIVTHTQDGTMGPEQAELLISQGADPGRIVIGHMDGNTDIHYHIRTLEMGVSIAFDRFGLEGMGRYPSDAERLEVLLKLLDKGYEKKIMLSHDTVNFWLGRAVNMPEEIRAKWHVTYIFNQIIPELQMAGVTDELLHILFVENPRRLFGEN